MEESKTQAANGRVGCLVRHSAAGEPVRYWLRDGVTRIGRDSSNDIAIEGEQAGVVSARHAEVRTEDGEFQVADLNSTNGLYVNGERVTSARLEPGTAIRLGSAGPLFTFERHQERPPDIGATIVLPAGQAIPELRAAARQPQEAGKHDQELMRAVERARAARESGGGNQTVILMRQVLNMAVTRSSRRLRVVIGVLVATLAGTVAYGYWRIHDLERTKSGIDEQITRLEARLASGNVPQEELDTLIDSLNRYQEQAQSLQDNLLYRIGGPAHERAYVERELRLLLEEFGADSYSVPPDFLERVNVYIERYQARDRPKMQVAMGRARKELEQVRRILVQEKLPPDFAYMVLVESAFISESESSEGAAGIWQFTPPTARHYGLRVDGQVDERLNLEKSTRAASRYIRELILDFGSGQAVMLAMAAYNVGPTKVRRAVRRVEDPIKQRNFWYLYRARALPAETREYVPKTIAAMIIGRNPSRFGF